MQAVLGDRVGSQRNNSLRYSRSFTKAPTESVESQNRKVARIAEFMRRAVSVDLDSPMTSLHPSEREKHPSVGARAKT